MIVLQIAYAFRWRVNSDEPQHLHVVWAWTQGLLPYRDVFDNHAPLFQMLSAPLLSLLGERADIVAWMRLEELPFWVLALWCIWRIGSALYSTRAGVLAVALTALAPLFSTLAVEFRPDMPWTAVWLAAVAIAVGGTMTPRRALLAGMAAGCALALSMKTLLLVASLGFSWLLVVLVQTRHGARFGLRAAASRIAAGACGFVLLPLCVALFFSTRGAGPAMLDDVLLYNRVPGMLHRPHWMAWVLPVALPLLVWLAMSLLRGASKPERGLQRATLLLSALTYAIVVVCYWPLPTQQDVLPLVPLLMVAVAGGVMALVQRRGTGWRALPWVLLGAEILFMLIDKAPWVNRQTEYTQTLATVLALASPSDTVMDCKGGSIFRTRPTRLVLEGITRRRIALGWTADDIPEHLRQTRVAIACGELPPRTRAFLDDNYLVVSDQMQVAVAGKRLSAVPAATAVPFDVGVAAPYAAITDSASGVFIGSIDGMTYAGPRVLEPGPHVLVSSQAARTVELVWSKALLQGFRGDLKPAGR